MEFFQVLEAGNDTLAWVVGSYGGDGVGGEIYGVLSGFGGWE